MAFVWEGLWNGGEFFEFLENHFQGHVECWLMAVLSSLEELNLS
jgi:hypothetical protein